MNSESKPSLAKQIMYWVGWVIGVLPCLMLFMSAYFKLSSHPMAVEGFEKMGYPANSLLPLGIAEAGATVLYLIPQTAVLGAILLTGYLGGATDVHVRGGESILTPVGLGVLIWLGLFLRDWRVRALTPWRKYWRLGDVAGPQSPLEK